MYAGTLPEHAHKEARGRRQVSFLSCPPPEAFLRQGLSFNLKLAILTRQTGQRALRDPLSPPPSSGSRRGRIALLCILRTGHFTQSLLPSLLLRLWMDSGLKPGKAPSPNNYNVGLRRQKTWGPPLRQPLPRGQQAHGDQHSQPLRRSPHVLYSSGSCGQPQRGLLGL